MPIAPVSSVAVSPALLSALAKLYQAPEAALPAESTLPDQTSNASFSAIMDLAGSLRSTNPDEAARLDRYAQGISTRNMPGYNPVTDIPMNVALATGYEGVKALPAPIGDPILSALGYDRKTTGQQTSAASLANVLALLQGLTGGG